MQNMVELAKPEQADEVIAQDLAIIFRYAHGQESSARAHKEMEKFRLEHPQAPVYLVRTNQNSGTSEHLVGMLGVTDETPQVLIVREGDVRFHAEGDAIRLEAIRAAAS